MIATSHCRLLVGLLFAALFFQGMPVPPATSAVTLGFPGEPGGSGLSFAYSQTFGTIEAPYQNGTTHLNAPHALAVDASGALWVVEQEGSRVLQFSLDGTPQQTLGTPGLHLFGSESFIEPQDLAIAPDQHRWIADQTRLVEFDVQGQFIRNVPAEGSDQPSSAVGRFELVTGLAFDQQGHLFTADAISNRVQVFDWSPGIAPVYRTSIPGFTAPRKVKALANGNVLVVDQNGIYRCGYAAPHSWSCLKNNSEQYTFLDAAYAAEGVVLALVANASEANQTLLLRCPNVSQCSVLAATRLPARAIALDAGGTIYTAATSSHVVERYTPEGRMPEIVQGTQDRSILSDERHFYAPLVKIGPDGNFYVLEQRGCRLHKFSPSWQHIWTFGEAGACHTAGNPLTNPRGMDFSAEGLIYVADQWRVLIFDPADGMLYGKIGPDQPEDKGAFLQLADVTLDRSNGLVYILDGSRAGAGVSIYTYFGVFRQDFIGISQTCEPQSNSQLCRPTAISVDPQGNVYIADAEKHAILKFDRQGRFLFRIAGSGHSAIGEIHDLAADQDGRLYAADSTYDRVQVFDRDGLYLATIGGLTGSTPGAFRAPTSTAIDAQGNVVVADAVNASWQSFRRGYPGWKQANVNGFGQQADYRLEALAAHDGMLYAAAGGDTTAALWRSADATVWILSGLPAGARPRGLQGLDTDLYLNAGHRLWKQNGEQWVLIWEAPTSSTTIGAMTAFEGNLYFATNTGAPEIWRVDQDDEQHSILLPTSAALAQLDVTAFYSFQNRLYAVVNHTGVAMEFWRLNQAGSAWERVVASGLQDGASRCQRMLSVAVFQQHIYAAAACPTATRIFRSGDGTAWVPVGAGLPAGAGISIDALAAGDGRLFAAVSQTAGVAVYNTEDGTQWRQIASDGFGDPAAQQTRAGAAIVLHDQLFLGVDNPAKGAQIWRFQGEAPLSGATMLFLPWLRR